MLRESADQLHRALLRSFPPTCDYPSDAFGSATMPAPLAYFLQRTLESRLANVGDLAPSPWYDVDAPVVQATREAWRTALLSTAHVPGSAWSKTLEHAVRLVLAYLVRPAQTLTAFVYGSEDRHVETSAVMHRLSYFSEYSYLHAGAREYVSKEQLGHVNRTPFLNLITRLDRAYTAGYGADDWIRHLSPLFETLRPVPAGGVPIELLRIFFEHKAATEIIQRLQAEEEQRGIALLDEAGLYRLMTRRGGTSKGTGAAPSASSRSAVQAEGPPLTSVDQRESKGSAEGRALPDVTEPVKADEESAPLWMRFRKPASEPTIEPEPAITASPAAQKERKPHPVDDETEFLDLPVEVTDEDFAFRTFEVGLDDLDTPDELLPDEESEPGASRARKEAPALPAGERRDPVEPGTRRLADVVADALRDVPPAAGQDPQGQQPLPASQPSEGDERGEKAVPLWMRFRKPSDLPLGETLKAGQGISRPSNVPGGSRSDERGGRMPEESAGRVPAGSVPPGQDSVYRPLEVIERALFGPNDPERRRWFVQQLFGDSDENYAEVLRAIHATESWPEASRVIARDVFRRNNVNIYSDPAVAFTDAVEAYFRQSQ